MFLYPVFYQCSHIHFLYSPPWHWSPSWPLFSSFNQNTQSTLRKLTWEKTRLHTCVFNLPAKPWTSRNIRFLQFIHLCSHYTSFTVSTCIILQLLLSTALYYIRHLDLKESLLFPLTVFSCVKWTVAPSLFSLKQIMSLLCSAGSSVVTFSRLGPADTAIRLTPTADYTRLSSGNHSHRLTQCIWCVKSFTSRGHIIKNHVFNGTVNLYIYKKKDIEQPINRQVLLIIQFLFLTFYLKLINKKPLIAHVVWTDPVMLWSNNPFLSRSGMKEVLREREEMNRQLKDEEEKRQVVLNAIKHQEEKLRQLNETLLQIHDNQEQIHATCLLLDRTEADYNKVGVSNCQNHSAPASWGVMLNCRSVRKT